MKVKYLLLGVGALFATIGYMGYRKKIPSPEPVAVQEIPIPAKEVKKAPPPPLEKKEEEVNLVPLLFALDSSRLPFVETISYTSRVPWLKGRPAWISDYASHYETSRHFIARSLNRKPDYLSQKVGPGDRFNVFKKEKNIEFQLLVDLSKNKMRFYLIDNDTKEKILLKTYPVASGQIDSCKKSGSLTPLGKFSLGNRIGIYKPGNMGIFHDVKTEMVQVFGTRWIPFEGEIADCTDAAKGLGIHGCPWAETPESRELAEDKSKLGSYVSDGCIRMAQEDIEELFAIIITKKATIEIVREFIEVQE